MCTSAPKFMLEDMYREPTGVMAHRVSMSVDVSGLLWFAFLAKERLQSRSIKGRGPYDGESRMHC
jgi:hypothetical protein